MTSKNANAEERKRQEKLKKLMDARLQKFPNESFDARFAAVANSEEGGQLFAAMQSPRHAALLGRTWPIPDAEFRRLWLAKFGPPVTGTGPGISQYPSYPSEGESTRRTAAAAGGSFQGDAKIKEEGRRGFMDEVARLMATGRNYDQAWSEAGSTSPGKEFYAQWARGAAQIKSGA